ncbi:hypothetical protein A3770_01p07630 [Chloropicon primus]|uniref:HTH HARE-type domain-containing protein n=1 Tax=Chloropicon primus TaxID=1764295 RepID=A0A5B8MEY0_9CHLO|nr:hypothetical protein A3770_01p07630 [Chloropicon primus]|eukprot:QDZ18245.1 hypothetical protein A3770_01p07630 [Chloropicon primus]
MIAAARAVAGGDDDKGGLSPGAMDMDVDGECVQSFMTDSTTIIEEESDSEDMDMDGECLGSFVTGSTTIIEEESDSEEDSGGADSSCQPETAQVTMMGGNARPFRTRNGKRTLVAAVYLVLQDAGGSVRAKEIHARIQAKKLYVFRRRDGSVHTDPKSMRKTVRSACSRSPFFVRTALGRYAIAKKYLNGSNTQGAPGTSPLRDAIYRVLQDAGGSLRAKEILGRIRAKKLYVFRRRDGSVHTDLQRMRKAVNWACIASPFFVRTAYGRYAIAKESLNGSNTQGAVRPSPLRDAIYRVLQDARGSLHYEEIFGRIRAKKLHVFRRKDGSVSTDLKRMRDTVISVCSHSPRFVRTERGTYAIAKKYLNGSNTQDAVSTSPLRDAIYRVLQDAGGSLHYREIQAKVQAKKLYVFKRRDGSVSTDLKSMRDTVISVCSHSPRVARTARGTYAIAKKYLNRSTADNLNEQNSNAANNNNNMKTTRSPSPSPYALDLREALESGLMTEEEYASAVQEAQRYDSKSPEKKREIADYNEALRIIFADASLKLSDKEQCIVKREYLEEVGLCNPRRSSKRRPSKAVPSIVKVKQEE